MVFGKFFTERSLNPNYLNPLFEPYRPYYSDDAYNASIFHKFAAPNQTKPTSPGS